MELFVYVSITCNVTSLLGNTNKVIVYNHLYPLKFTLGDMKASTYVRFITKQFTISRSILCTTQLVSATIIKLLTKHKHGVESIDLVD